VQLYKQEVSNLYKGSILKLSLLIVSFSIILSCGGKTDYEDIYGVWEGIMHEKKINIQFSSEHKCVLSINNIESDIVEILHGNYEIDFSKRPIPLSINNIKEINHSLHTIIRFNNNELLMANFAPKWRLRPISFDDDTSILLTRISQNSEPSKNQINYRNNQ